MKITLKWLEEIDACYKGVKWFKNQKETEAIKVLEALIADNKLEWANWTICRVLNRKQRIQYAIFAAEQVVNIFEKKYPDDKRPRQAIKAAKKVLKHNTANNRITARAAAWAAGDARIAGIATWAAAGAAGAAGAEVGDAWATAGAAGIAAWAAARAAGAAAGDAAFKEMQLKILRYGIGLLTE